MSHWDNIKIPKYGKSDSMVRFENGNQEEPDKPIVREVKKVLFDWDAYSKSILKRANKLRQNETNT